MSDIPSVDRDELETKTLTADSSQLLSALNIFIAGHGQCGNNIADAFYQLGHRPVSAINTNTQDMARLKLPKENQLVIGDDGEGGAARNLAQGKMIAERYREEIRDHLKSCMGDEVLDYGLVCTSAGGGTGPGGFSTMVSVMQDLLAPFRRKNEPNVGAIMALPSSGEDPNVMRNAYYTLLEALDMVEAGILSPLILLDNAKMQSLKGVSVANFFPTINKKIAQHIIRFNHVAALDGGIWQFDKADWRSIFTSGVVTFAVTPIERMEVEVKKEMPDGSVAIKRVPKYYIAEEVKDNLKDTVLLDVPNYRNSNRAGCICVGTSSVLHEIPPTDMENGFKEFGKMLADDHSIMRGIYEAEEGEEVGLVINTVIGNLGRPEAYLKKLKEAGRVVD